MKPMIIILATLLAGCTSASYRHVEGNNVTLLNIKSGASASVTDGTKVITMDATGACK